VRGESLDERHKSVALGSEIEYKGPRKRSFRVGVIHLVIFKTPQLL
jgi:hypothetical protein